MSLKNLNAGTIPQLADAMNKPVIDAELKRIVDDLEQRGRDGQTRVLTIQLTFAAGERDGRYTISTAVSSKIPPQKTPKTTGKLVYDQDAKRWQMQFRSDNCENPDQPTMFAEGEIPNED